MSLRLKKSRVAKIEHYDADSDVKFSVTFSFKFAEDEKYLKDTRELMSDIPADGESDMGNQAYQILYQNLRQSIIKWQGILDDDQEGDVELPLYDDQGKVIEFNQKLVFQAIKNIPEMFAKVMDAYKGITSKNSKTGLTEKSTGDGQ